MTVSSIRPSARHQSLFTSKQVPVSALLISLLALVVAASGNFLWPERLPDAFALLWLLALIPPFLLAYYKGWQGAALALAAGMVLLIGVEVGGSMLEDRQVRWWVVNGVIVVLVAVSLGAGMVSERLRRHASDVLDLAFSDPLTGLPNRRVLDLHLEQEFALAARGGALAIALFDIDGFKEHNDTEGHNAGDDVLRLVADTLRANTRASDISGRLGGDEFLSILPGESAGTAFSFAERILTALQEATSLEAREISVSVGVAAHQPIMSHSAELLEAADQALYAAKDLGGARAVVHLDGQRGVHAPVMASSVRPTTRATAQRLRNAEVD